MSSKGKEREKKSQSGIIFCKLYYVIYVINTSYNKCYNQFMKKYLFLLLIVFYGLNVKSQTLDSIYYEVDKYK
jgi:hypothetical protein